MMNSKLLAVGGLRRKASEIMSNVGVGSSPTFTDPSSPSLGHIKTVEQVYHLLTPKPKNLLDSSQRKLVHYGTLTYFSPNTVTKKPRVLFLFTDLLLVTKRTGSEKYLLRVWINLRPGIKIYSMPQSTNFEFRLLITVPSSVKSVKQRRIILHGGSAKDKETWVKLLVHQLWLISGSQGPDPSLRFEDGRQLTEDEQREEQEDDDDNNVEDFDETEDELGLTIKKPKKEEKKVTKKPTTSSSTSSKPAPSTPTLNQDEEFKKLGFVEVPDDSDEEPPLSKTPKSSKPSQSSDPQPVVPPSLPPSVPSHSKPLHKTPSNSLPPPPPPSILPTSSPSPTPLITSSSEDLISISPSSPSVAVNSPSSAPQALPPQAMSPQALSPQGMPPQGYIYPYPYPGMPYPPGYQPGMQPAMPPQGMQPQGYPGMPPYYPYPYPPQYYPQGMQPGMQPGMQQYPYNYQPPPGVSSTVLQPLPPSVKHLIAPDLLGISFGTETSGVKPEDKKEELI